VPNVRKLVLLAVVLVVVAVTLVFVLENQQTVGLVFFGFTAPQLPVSVLTTGALLVGLLIGPFVGGLLRLSRRPNKARA